ncbi:MAG: hypothetical protein CFE41_03560 [Burkholderiales bacterium PBB2]|nr:MAG: hypothetical protein CFE41_03560 [Burkholderiales bacterium PBB2]
MNGQLDWADATAYFGNDLEVHRRHLADAGMATHGLLACRFLKGDSSRMMSGDGDHAEQKLIHSKLWTEELARALANWDPRSSPMLILVALNRSPCGDCAHLLASALQRFNNDYSLTTERQHFVLASLGYYHSAKATQHSTRGLPQTFTTDKGMRALKEAGWKLCTLTFDAKTTRRGKELSRYLQKMQKHG